MQSLRWPGHQAQLLAELQRQQHRAQFCDTLLQAGGISVPAHGCVLAALSPYLSQRLSTSPPPPHGQKQQLQLQAVTAQTLLKLVGLLYSGELEVKGEKEHKDVLAAAHQFGVYDIVTGCDAVATRGGEVPERPQRGGSCRETVVHAGDGGERRQGLKTRDAHVQAEITGKKSCVSVGTQTCRVAPLSRKTTTPTPERRTSGANYSVSLQTRSFALDKQLCLTPCPTVVSDGESTLGRTVGIATNHTSFSASITDTCSLSADGDPSILTSWEENISGDSSESGDGTCESTAERRRREEGTANGRKIDDDDDNGDEGDVEHPSRESRGGVSGEETGDSAEKRLTHSRAAVKSLAKMKQMEQISIRLKLKKRTEGEAWEVVSVQDATEMLSTCFLKGCSNYTTQIDLEEVQTASSSAHPSQKPEIQNLHLIISPRHPNCCSDPRPPSPGCKTVNPSGDLESAALAQPAGSVEESDEQIERLLEDIMMGLNILPDLEEDDRKPQLSPSRKPACCHRSSGNAARCPAACAFFQGLGAQSSCSADPGIPCFCGARSDTSHPSLPGPRPECLMQQHRRTEGMSCRDVSSSRSAAAESMVPLACYSNGLKLDYCHPSQEEPGILDLLPLRSGPAPALPCMDDLRLPPRLSPLESSTPAAGRGNPSNPLLRNRPWLSETPGSLQFPLSAITAGTTAPSHHTGKSCASDRPLQRPRPGGPCTETSTVEVVKEMGTNATGGVREEKKRRKRGRPRSREDAGAESAAPDDTGKSCASEPPLQHPRPGGPCAETGTVEVVKETGTNATGGVREKKRKRGRPRTREDAGAESAAPDGTSQKQDRAGSVSAFKRRWSRSLLAPSSSGELRPAPWKSEEKPTVAQTAAEKAGGPGNLWAERIRTRGFVKRSQESSGDAPPLDFQVLKPAVRRRRRVVSFPQRKRGRPRKIKLEESCLDAVPAGAGPGVGAASLGDGGEQKVQAPKVEKDEEVKRSCKKQRRNPADGDAADGDAALPKKSVRADSAEHADGDKNSNHLGTSKRSWVATLKEFQKLIRRKNSSSRKSSQDINHPARDEGKVKNESAHEEQVSGEAGAEAGVHGLHHVALDENHNQVFNKSNPEDARRDPSPPRQPSEQQPGQRACGAEQPLKNADKEEVRGGGGSDRTPSANNLGAESLSDARQTPDKPWASGADGNISAQGEKEEDVEVDVLVYSPGEDPPPREAEDGPNIVLLSDEEEEQEEEEDDIIEIDVTGD